MSLVRFKELLSFSGLKLANDVCIITNDGAPTDGTTGTGVARCGPGSLCVDFSNAKLYINTNTKASPTWTLVGAQTT